MSSWQAKALTAYFRLLRIVNRPPQQFDLAKDRANAAFGPRFKGELAPAERQPVTVGNIPAEWLIPRDIKAGRTLLYLHGGGFVRGSIESHRTLTINMAYITHARALIIGYRLAPENPFPAASEDCLAAYRWLLSQGVRPEQLIVAGDSAGGCFTLLLLVHLRDLSLPLPATAICLSPATDLAMTGESYERNAQSDFLFERRHIAHWFGLYLGAHDPYDPQVSPLYADLHGLPPLLIQVGRAELLLSDSTMFVERARAAGVNVTLEILERGQHVQQMAAKVLPEAREALTHIGQFVESHLR